MERVIAEKMTVRDLTLSVRKQQVQRRLEKEENKDFWDVYAKDTGYNMLTLEAAIKEGRQWAEEDMDRRNSLKSFDAWWLANASTLERHGVKAAAEAAWKARSKT